MLRNIRESNVIEYSLENGDVLDFTKLISGEVLRLRLDGNDLIIYEDNNEVHIKNIVNTVQDSSDGITIFDTDNQAIDSLDKLQEVLNNQVSVEFDFADPNEEVIVDIFNSIGLGLSYSRGSIGGDLYYHNLLGYTDFGARGGLGRLSFSGGSAGSTSTVEPTPDPEPSYSLSVKAVSSQVFDDALEWGSAPSADNRTARGTITYEGGTLHINGTAVSVGTTISTEYGILRILSLQANDDGTTSVLYEYELEKAGDHTQTDSDISETFNLSVVDDSGNTVSKDSLDIAIVDDTPLATDDNVEVTLGEGVAVDQSVNVFDNDHWNADDRDESGNVTDKTITNVTIEWGGGTITIPGGWDPNDPNGRSISLNGGTLTIKPDGTVSFHADDGGNVDQDKDIVVNYTITDDDGSTDNAKVTLDLNGVPSIIITPEGDLTDDGKNRAFEAYMEDGSDPQQDGSTHDYAVIRGTFDVKGAVEVIIESATLNMNGSTKIYSQYGLLVVTGHGDGTFSYTYTLFHNADHEEKYNADGSVASIKDIYDDFAIKAIDSDGDATDATLSIKIEDDKPVAVGDGSHSVEEGKDNEVGNILDNDDTNADKNDGVKIIWVKVTVGGVEYKLEGPEGGPYSGEVNGGILTIHADGKVTWNASGRDLPDWLGNIDIEYGITDSDGSTSSAGMTITLDRKPGITIDPDPDDAEPGSDSAKDSVDEKGLAGGTGENADGDPNNNSDNSEHTSGKGVITIKDGQEVTIKDKDGNSHNFPEEGKSITVDGPHGKLTITNEGDGKYTYEYELTKNADHTGGDDTVSDNFEITVKDGDSGDDSDSVTGTISINIKDNAPDAIDDGKQSIDISDPNNIADFSKNVLDNDLFGADGGKGGITHVTAKLPDGTEVTLTGDATNGWTADVNGGTLTISPDGTVGFKVTDATQVDHSKDITITYTIEDSDGDSDTAEMTIDFKGKPDVTIDPDPDPDPDDHTDPAEGDNATGNVYESGMDNKGTEADTDKEYAKGTINTKNGDKVTIIDADGKEVELNPNGLVEIKGEYGTLKVTGNGDGTFSYEYQLTKNADHSKGDVTDDFKITVEGEDTDGDNDTDTGTLTINIKDDAPDADDDGSTIIEVGDNVAIINKVDMVDLLDGDKWGADGAKDGKNEITKVEVTVGGGSPVTLTKDANGNYVGEFNNGTLTITPDGKVSFVAPDGSVVDKDQDIKITYTIEDSDGDSDTGEYTINFAGKPGVTVDPDGKDEGDPGSANADDSVNESGLNQADTDKDGTGEGAQTDGSVNNDPSESTDGDGKTGTISLENADSATINGESFPGAGDAPLLITTDKGQLTVTYVSEGEYSYVYVLTSDQDHSGGDVNDVFNIVVINSETGKQGEGSLTINIVDDEPIATTDGKVTLNVEDQGDASWTGYDVSKNLLDNDVWGADSYQNGDSSGKITSIKLFLGDTEIDITGSGDATNGWVFNDVNGGTLVIKPDGTVTFKTTDTSVEVDQDNDIRIEYTITDGDGSTSSADFTIDFDGKPDITVDPDPDDGKPGASDSSETVYESGLNQTGTIKDGTEEDTDKEFATGQFTIEHGDEITINGQTILPNGTVIINGAHGTLTVKGNGDGTYDYTYELKENVTHNAPPSTDPIKDEFTILVVDHENDGSTQTANGSLTINIEDDAPVAKDDAVVIGLDEKTPIDVSNNVFGNDVWGADGPADGKTQAFNGTPKVTYDADGNGIAEEITLTGDATNGWTASINGGTLTINPDGTVTFTAPDRSKFSQDKDITVEYQIIDSDGDTSDAQLVLDFTGTPGVIIDPDPDPGNDPGSANETDTVYEAGLNQDGTDKDGTGEGAQTDGSVNNDPRESTDGTLTIVNGSKVEIRDADGTLQELPTTGSKTIKGEYGTLVVTRGADGNYTYVYTLSKDVNHKDGDVKDEFDIVVTNEEGETGNGKLTIDIIDDVPQATDDGTHTIAVGETGAVDWNYDGKKLLDNDLWGADGAKDGKQVITDVKAKLADGSDVTLTKDVDGNWVGSVNNGTLTIKPDGTITFHADDGTKVDQDKDITVEYTIEDGDEDARQGHITLDFNGEPSIIVDPDPDDGKPGTSDGSETVSESGLNQDGTIKDGTEEDTDKEFAEGTFATEHADEITINGKTVLIDGTVIIKGTYGNLTVTGDGTGNFTYKYELTTNIDHSDGNPDKDIFDIAVTDKESTGDETVHGTITIDIEDDVPQAKDDAVVIGLDSTGAIDVSNNVFGNDAWGADGPADGKTPAFNGTPRVTYDINGDGTADEITLTGNATTGWTATIDGGVLTIKPDGTVTFTAPDRSKFSQDNDITVNYQIVDSDGDTSDAKLVIDFEGTPGVIIDPDPDPGNDPGSANEKDTVYEAGLDQAGTTDDGTNAGDGSDKTDGTLTIVNGSTVKIKGTDGEHELPTTTGGSETIQGKYGILVVTREADGTYKYEYTLSQDIDHGSTDLISDEIFDITVINEKGDIGNGSLTIDIVDDKPVAVSEADAVLNAEDQSDPSWTGFDGSWKVLENDKWGADGYQDQESTGKITDIVVSIGGEEVTVSGNKVDGWTVDNVNGGTLTIKPDGTVTFKTTDTSVEVDQDSDIKITYTITDGDGDTSSADFTIDFDGKPSVIVDPDPDDGKPGAANSNDSVSEEGLDQDGTIKDGSDKDSDKEFTEGTFTIEHGDEITINGKTVLIDGTVIIKGAYGNLTVTGDGTGNFTYKYELTTNIDHSDAIPDKDIFNIVVTDNEDGKPDQTATGSLTIDITDDTPTASDDTVSASLDGSTAIDVSGNVFDNDAWGADGPADGKTPAFNGTPKVTYDLNGDGTADEITLTGNATTGWTATIDGGTLTIKPDGTVTFTANDSSVFKQDNDIIVEYQIIDSDGDTSDAKLVIDFTGEPSVIIDPKPEPEDNIPGSANEKDTVYEAGLDQTGTSDDGTSVGDGTHKTDGTLTIINGVKVEIKGTGASIELPTTIGGSETI
ncbi:MAG: beta strand repeat-containing protein, partial [Alphaproteobacteria bacterium]